MPLMEYNLDLTNWENKQKKAMAHQEERHQKPMS